MRVGTPGFEPGRLREAMRARGVNTMLALAGLLGKNTSTVSRWLDGSSAPEPATIEQLARVLNVRGEFFLTSRSEAAGTVFWRSVAAARKRDLERQEARMSWLQHISEVVEEFVEFPAVNLPDVMGSSSYRQLRNDDIEAVALDLRRYWNMGEGPCWDVVRHMERLGFVVASDEMGTSSLDGLCQWREDRQRPFVLLASDKMSFFRRQMDAAHEMAHALLHRRVSPDDLRRDFEIIEAQAFRLASAFLMPSTSYAVALVRPTLATFHAMKERWRVSIKAQIRRASDLKILDKDQATSLYKYYSAKGWSREEPLDRLFPPTQPRLLADALQMAVDSGAVGRTELLQRYFLLPASDVEVLGGLTPGWFEMGEVVPLTLRPEPRQKRSFTQSSGGVVTLFEARSSEDQDEEVGFRDGS